MSRVYKPLTAIALLTIHFCTKANAQQDTTAKQLGEVVVTGQYTPQPLRNSVYKVRTINAERIQMRGATDVIGVLNSELGVRIGQDNTIGENNLVMSGLGGNRVKILLDGVPLIDRDGISKQSLTQIDINSVEKIEIVDGPMSVVYGSDAMAAVINIITKKGSKSGNNLSVHARIQEETAGSTYSPFADEGMHTENVSVNWNNTHWRVSGFVTRNDFGGFTDTASFPAKVFKPKTQWLGGGTLGYRNNKLNTWYRLDYANEELLAASPANVNTGISFQQHFVTNRYTHQAQLDWTLTKKVKLNSAVSFQDYKRETKTYNKSYVNGSETVNNPVGSGYWDVSKFQTFFVRSTANWTVSDKLALQPGFEVKYDNSAGERIETGKKDITDYSVFVSSEYRPNSIINIRPGLRFSKNSVYDAPPVIPSINAKIVINKKLDVRLSYARGFRAPILRELYFTFHDANHNIVGNPDLKAETSDSYMASLTCNAVSNATLTLTSSITGFYNNYNNFIDLYVDPITTNYKYFNISKYKTIGATFENTISWKRLTATLGFSYIAYYNAAAGH